MNIIWLYLISLGTVFLVLSTGYFVNYKGSNLLKLHSSSINSIEITGSKLSEMLIAKNKLLKIHITNLNSKHTNYFSLKYNVIKVSPEINSSTSLSALALSSYLANQARLGQKKTILYCLKLIISFITKLCSIVFIPVVLVCAIIYASHQSSIINMIILISLIAYSSSLIFQLIILCFELISTKKLNNDIASLKLFTNEELKQISTLTRAICTNRFFDYTKSSLFFFSLASPNLISMNSSK